MPPPAPPITPHIKIEYQASCQPPSTLTATNTTTTANFSWSAPAGGDPVLNYEWELRTSGLPGSGSTGLHSAGTTTGVNQNFTNLSPQTRYVFYVKTACSPSGISGYAMFEMSTRANDNCGGAIPLVVDNDLGCTNAYTDSTTMATESLAGCTGTADDDVWFKVF